jgi:16S rRNA (guanine527-N7)-methyltransferase
MTEQSLTSEPLVFEPELSDTLLKYLTILLEYNKTTNLTSIRDWDEAVVKHLHDSLSIKLWAGKKGSIRILDLGSGAGLPGIPLSAIYPDDKVFLLEANNKKAKFMEYAIDQLGLLNCSLLKGRSEDLARDNELRETFDLVTTRAVSQLPVLLELSFPFLKVGGFLVAYKGPSVQDEILRAKSAVIELKADDPLVIKYALKEDRGTRNLILIRKLACTPLKYPRRPGIPEKKPL